MVRPLRVDVEDGSYHVTRISLLLAGIVLLALFVRFSGISFGLPHTECRPDESTIVSLAVNVTDGDPNPHFFYYPSFLIYLLAAIYQILALPAMLANDAYAGLREVVEANPAPFYLTARFVSAAMGGGSVLVLYGLVRRTFGQTAGLVSAFFLSVCYLHVRDSHFGTTDVPMTFLLLIGLDYTVRALRSGKPCDFRLAGLFTGLAASTKYAAMALPLSMIAGLACSVKSLSDVRAIFFNRNTLIYAIFGFAAFLAATPFALLDAGTFYSHFSGEMQHLASGHTVAGIPVPLILGRGWLYHAVVTLPGGMGLPLLLAGVVGLVWAFLIRPGEASVLFAFPLAFYLFAGRGYTVFVRYMIPVTPFLCVGAAVLVERVTARIVMPRVRVSVLLLMAVLVALPSMSRVFLFNRLLLRRDNRLLVADWLADHIPDGSTVMQTGGRWGQVDLPSNVQPLRRGGGLPDYIVVQNHPLVYSAISDAQQEMLTAGYNRAAVFPTMEKDVSVGMFDRLDAFYIPYAPLTGVERPGPEIYVYKNVKY